MRRREKKGRKILTILIVICLLLGGLGLIAYEVFAPTKRLERLGYNSDEIALIAGQLDGDAIKILLGYNYYDVRTVEVLQNSDFKSEKLADYLNRMERSDLEAERIVSLVNHRDYDAETDYTTLMAEILQAEYYVSPNMGRYFDYISVYDTNTAEITIEIIDDDTKARKIVELVNHNRDREFYSDPIATDTAQKELMLVNKYYSLGEDFSVDIVPLDVMYGASDVLMERETYGKFQKMYESALTDGIQLYVTSGYRGYNEQEEVFASYLNEGGMEYALKYAAKPGFSEHQTGRALDIFTPGTTLTTFTGTAAAKWLENHAHEFGFIMRYPLGKENLTGYNYEAWHYRYVGEEVAKYIYEHDMTLEEYYLYFVENKGNK